MLQHVYRCTVKNLLKNVTNLKNNAYIRCTEQHAKKTLFVNTFYPGMINYLSISNYDFNNGFIYECFELGVT